MKYSIFLLNFVENLSPFCKIVEMSIRATTPSWCIKPYCNETVNLLLSYIANKKSSIQDNMWYWWDGNDKSEIYLCKTNLLSLVHNTPTREYCDVWKWTEKPFCEIIQMSIGTRTPSRGLKPAFDKIIEMTIRATSPSRRVKP